MSRRHTSTFPASASRMVTASVAALLVAAVLLPATAVAQGDITPRDIQHEWQLLTQRGEDGKMEDVPAGVGATMLLRSNAAFGEAACSTYDSSYNQASDRLDVFVEPDDIEWRECDAISRAFDEQFYDNLSGVASIFRADDVLVVDDVIGDPLMIFTRAQIDNDPTAARWSLARIADADGATEPVIRGIFPWMEFLVGGSVVGDVGCGSFLGKYATNEGRIDITDVHYRLEGCIGAAGAQAERILQTLANITDFQVRPAGLTLKDENGIIRLALAPDLDVASRSWTPTAVYDADGRKQYGDGNELTTSAIQFLGPQYQGRSICRPFRGRALRSGLAVNLGQPQFIMDKGATAAEVCKGKASNGAPVGQIELAFVEAFEAAASYAMRGDELALTDVNGVTRAVLEPQPPLTGTTWAVFKMHNGKGLGNPKTDDDAPITATFADIDASTGGVVRGDTGVSNRFDENTYFASYDTPYATIVTIDRPERLGRGCAGKKLAKTAACKTEARFMKLLQRADGYIVRDEDLKFYDGRQPILVFRPLLVGDAEE